MKSIDYEEAVRAAGALAALMGVPAAKLIADVVAPVAGRLGCAILGCDAEPADKAPLPDLAGKYSDDADELAREAAGFSRR